MASFSEKFRHLTVRDRTRFAGLTFLMTAVPVASAWILVLIFSRSSHCNSPSPPRGCTLNEASNQLYLGIFLLFVTTGLVAGLAAIYWWALKEWGLVKMPGNDSAREDPPDVSAAGRPLSARRAGIAAMLAVLVIAATVITYHTSASHHPTVPASCHPRPGRPCVIRAGSTPSALVVTPDGRTLYVASNGDGTVTPVSTSTSIPGRPIPAGIGPDALAITPYGSTLYVANSIDDTVTPVSTYLRTPGAPIQVGSQPDALAVTPDGSTLYVANLRDGTVTPISTATDTASGCPASAPACPIQLQSSAWALAVAPNGRTLYVACSSTGTAEDNVTPVSTATDTPGGPIPTGSGPYALAVTPDGRTLYVANYDNNTVTPISTATSAPGRPIPVGTGPQALAITPDGSTLYVAIGDGTVKAITLSRQP